MTKKRFLIFLLLLLLVAGAGLYTLAEFGSWNPVSTAIGLVRVCIFQEPYAQIGILSKAYVSQSEHGFDLFLSAMEQWGYTHLPEEQMGSVHLFQDSAGNPQQVRFLVNAYYAKWIWY